MRRFFPVTGEYHGAHWFVKIDGKRYVTPLFLCLAAIVAADIAFAVDSIPAAFAITRDSVLIWMGNVFALLGLRALFVLVEGLIRRFRYLDETIAVVLALVAVKLLIEDVYKIGPEASLGMVAVCFAVGIVASLIADARDPDADAKRAERAPGAEPPTRARASAERRPSRSPSQTCRPDAGRASNPPGRGPARARPPPRRSSSSSASGSPARTALTSRRSSSSSRARVVERDLVADQDPVARRRCRRPAGRRGGRSRRRRSGSRSRG